MDYSQEDIININNQLFRRARNNMNENAEPIKDIDESNKLSAKSNLQIYGSELVNNLNQINYTFEQIESYLLVPSKIVKVKGSQLVVSDDTESNKPRVITLTPTTPISAIKSPTPPIEEEEEDELPGLFSRADFDLDYTLEDLEALIADYRQEIQRLIDLNLPEDEYSAEIRNELYQLEMMRAQEKKKRGTPPVIRLPKPPPPPRQEELDLPLPPALPALPAVPPPNKEFSRVDKTNKNLTAAEVEQQLIDTQQEIAKTRKQLDKLATLNKTVKVKEGIKQRNDYINDLGFDLEYLYNYGLFGSGMYRGGAVIKGKVIDTSPIKEMASKKGFKVADVKALLKEAGFPKKEVSQLRKDNILQYLEDKDRVAVQTETATATEFDALDEEPKDEAVANLGIAKELDTILNSVSNMGQNTPVPKYLDKVNELITNLIQFIGRTTVLYITRIKKNLNYLEEEQVKLIFDSTLKLKTNLSMLDGYKNMGGAIIKQTLYKQLVKETEGLYNEINNSIRNYNKLKDYTIFKGAGMDRLVGGYFIQSDNPFIRDTPTKRFL